jgi:hypothetical protein
MEWKDLQPIATFLAAIVTGVISAVVLWKLQAKKENSDIDLTILNSSLDEKFEEFKITLVGENSYLAERGKNAATKEDVRHITREIEAVRTEFAESVEILKSELSKKANLHRLQAEKEFEAYSKIWEKAAHAMLACGALLETPRKSGFTQENIDKEQKLLSKTSRGVEDLVFEVQRQRPFYPLEFYEELGILLNSNTQTLRDFALIKYEVDSKTSKVISIREMTDTERQKGEENLEEVLEVLGVVCELMRSRMSGN